MRMWVMVVMVSTLLLTLVSTSMGAGALGRRTFRATDDNNRNFVTLESSGQLETLFSLTSSLTITTDLNLDSIQDAPRLEMTVDLSKLTTGFADRNSTVFSRTFLDFGAATNLSFRLTGFEKSRSSVLINEQRIEVTGTGELTLGGKTVNIAMDLFLTRLEQNGITRGRLPGDLLHMVGTFNFRLSDFGIRIPQEALLKLNDLIKIQFDAFATNQ
jgi:polyisoprenoid-binding protein YceI